MKKRHVKLIKEARKKIKMVLQSKKVTMETKKRAKYYWIQTKITEKHLKASTKYH